MDDLISMNNKRYRVWMRQGYAVDIDAKKFEIVTVNDKPIKIKFYGDNNCLLAEFFADSIHGWASITCLVDVTQ